MNLDLRKGKKRKVLLTNESTFYFYSNYIVTFFNPCKGVFT